MAGWRIEGQYMESCNCTYLCPCIGSNLTARPSEGDCKAAVALRIDRGEKDGVKLNGLSFIVMLHSPAAMAEGNMTVGLIVDERASEAQVKAIADIATGAAGGPMAALAPLVGKVAGVEKRAIRFEQDGMKFRVTAGELVDQSIEGVPGPARAGEPIYLDNTCHPVNARLALAKATRSKFDVFGMRWNDSSGKRNGHFAPFAWSA
ncbi:MAG TPA: DUF1326 domain-containing protein [Terriglobales bacterium]|nr:DUF1326 domain-containing protein [Terriglobales bacterium]